MLIDKIIYGKRGAGKTQTILELAIEHFRSGAKVIIVTDNSTCAQSMHSRFKELSKKPVSSFDNWVAFVSAGNVKTVFSDQFDVLLIDVDNTKTLHDAMYVLERDGGFTKVNTMTVTIKDCDVIKGYIEEQVEVMCDSCKQFFGIPVHHLSYYNFKCPHCDSIQILLNWRNIKW